MKFLQKTVLVSLIFYPIIEQLEVNFIPVLSDIRKFLMLFVESENCVTLLLKESSN